MRNKEVLSKNLDLENLNQEIRSAKDSQTFQDALSDNEMKELWEKAINEEEQSS